jgi:serine phosphatase RsbU (regulator of sigma subunit)
MADLDEDKTVLSKSTVVRTRTADQAWAHYLVVVEGEDQGRRIALGKQPLVIGRAAPADVVLADSRVSRAHCRVCLAADEVVVIDLESSNGTFLDGVRLAGGAPLPVGSRLQIGSYVFEHEYRIRREVEESQQLDKDIEQAWRYIQALLPPPLFEGPIRSDWALVPCARLGGDAFGYRFLDARYFAMYLIDVSGHGTGAAMHAVSLINVLRQDALPAADYRNPAKVLEALNAMFRMETHGELYFTMWYGVYDLEARTLAYSSGGHPAGYLVSADRRDAVPLKTKNPSIGIAPRMSFQAETVEVAPGSTLYVFSDGVYEVTSKDGRDWEVGDFVALMRASPIAGTSEPQRLLHAVRESAQSPALEDDFSLMAFTFAAATAGRTPDETWPRK